jgi:HNH endonuclease
MSLCQWDGCRVDTGPPATPAQPRHRKFCDDHRRLRLAQVAREAWSARRGHRGGTEDRYEGGDGYVLVRLEGGWIAEHRAVMAAMLGRPLRKGESVHHINGIRNDNRPANLELWVGPIRYGQRAVDITCHNCGEPYLVKRP